MYIRRLLKYYFHVKASLNSLYKNIPSTYKINTTLYESMSVKRPCEPNEITNFKRK